MKVIIKAEDAAIYDRTFSENEVDFKFEPKTDGTVYLVGVEGKTENVKRSLQVLEKKAPWVSLEPSRDETPSDT